MGELADPARLRDVLQANRVELAAIALALPWNAPEETAHERAEADKAIALAERISRCAALHGAVADGSS